MTAARVDLNPSRVEVVRVPAGRVELVNWHWPDLIDFTLTEREMMIEMPLPPLATDGSVCFPEIAPDKRCMIGSLFVRWPGIAVSGRAEGGHIRVLRLVLSDELTAPLLALNPNPSLSFLQSLLVLRNDPIRQLMRLLYREFENQIDRSDTAMAAISDLLVLELQRHISREPQGGRIGRLAAWQFRRIQRRLADGGTAPTVAELAALCGISPRHLHRQFLALTGKTVSDYIEAARIEEAKQMLSRCDLPVKSIAQRCGFAYGNSFARAFRRSTGLSPQAYRQRTAGTDSAAILLSHGE